MFEFLTNVITEIIDRDFVSLRTSNISSQTEADNVVIELRQKLKPAVDSLTFIWKAATNNGSKDDLRELLKIVDEVLNKEYLAQSVGVIRQGIEDKLK